MTEYFDLPLNMDRICRICLTEGTNLSPIFSTDQEVNDFSDLPQKIQVCGSIEIHEQDGLPSLICDICIYKASVAHEFRQQCQHSDAKLRMYYNKPTKVTIVVNIKCYIYAIHLIYQMYMFLNILGYIYTDRIRRNTSIIKRTS